MKPVPKLLKGNTQSKADQYRLWYYRFVTKDTATNALPFTKLVALFEKSLLDAENRASSLKPLDQHVAKLGTPAQQSIPVNAEGIIALRRATPDAKNTEGRKPLQ